MNQYEIIYSDRNNSMNKAVRVGTDGQSVSDEFEANNPGSVVIMVRTETSIV